MREPEAVVAGERVVGAELRAAPGAVGVIGIHPSVAIVVDAVVTEGTAHAVRGLDVVPGGETVWILRVGEAIAVIVNI